MNLRYRIEWRYEFNKRRDNVLLWIAQHLPRRLRMWVVVCAMATAWAQAPGNRTPDEIGYSALMKGAGLDLR